MSATVATPAERLPKEARRPLVNFPVCGVCTYGYCCRPTMGAIAWCRIHVDQRERVGRVRVPAHVARLVGMAHRDAAHQPRVRGQQAARDAGADGPAAQQADAARARGRARRRGGNGFGRAQQAR